MPIGDLLAQISGGEVSSSKPSPKPSIPRSNMLPKRKADEELRSNVPKAPRTTTLSTTIGPRPTEPPPRLRQGEAPSALASRSGQPSRPLDRFNAQKLTNGSASKSGVLSSKPMNGANKVTKPVAPSRPSPGPAAATAAAPRAAPKKGSFAEILARGQRAQATMGQVGKIQHKKVEKGAAQKKEEPSKVDPRDPKKKQPSGYAGTSKPGQRSGTSSNGASANGRLKDSRMAMPDRTKESRAKTAAEEEREKKFKKSAVATTGYTGTARPKPGNTVKKRDVPRGGALLAAPAPRSRHSKSSRYDDDYDEDMDDFIDYDDGDEEQGPRYDYASDESSDMEAGLDDIDVEERRAELIARREDIEEERLERTLKAEKEERKRKALDALRAGRR